MLTRFLYRNNAKVVKHGYTAKQLHQAARRGRQHVIDTITV